MSDISDLSKVSLKAIEYAKSVLHDGTVIQSQSDEFDFLNYDDTQNIEGKEKYALIKARVNQGIIRKKALKKYSSKCVLCNMGFEPSLIASHIKEWTFSDNSEKGDLDNILLLCPNHDALFDKHYITFDNDGKIIISSELSSNDRVLLNIHEDMKISMNTKMSKYMEWHRGNLVN